MSGLNLQALSLWQGVLHRLVTAQEPDLSTRQMALLLTVYLSHPPHTVKHLSQHLKISKAATSRALDALTLLDYIKRKRDENDKRIVHIQRTVKGSIFLTELSQAITDVSASLSPKQ